MRRLCRYLLTIALTIILSFYVARAATVVDPWADFLEMPNGVVTIEDLIAFTDPADGDLKLAIATGVSPSTPILFWDPLTKLLTTAFTPPPDTYQGATPYWRSLMVFNGKLYAGLGTTQANQPTGTTHTGQIWQYDGTN